MKIYTVFSVLIEMLEGTKLAAITTTLQLDSSPVRAYLSLLTTHPVDKVFAEVDEIDFPLVRVEFDKPSLTLKFYPSDELMRFVSSAMRLE